MDPGELADQAAEDDDRDGGEQDVRERALTSGLAPGDHRSQEDPGRKVGARDEEDRELHMEGACQVVGEDLSKVDAEKATQVRTVVLGGGADQGLDQEQRGHDQKEPGGRALGGRKRHLAGGPEGESGLLASPPAKKVPSPEGTKEQPDPAEQGDQRDDTPEKDVGRRRVADQFLGGPVVGVGVVVTRSPRRRRPGRPAEEGGQLLDLLRIGNRVRAQPELRRWVAEVVLVVAPQPFECPGLSGAVGDRVGRRVVAIGLEVVDRPLLGAIDAFTPVLVLHRQRRPVQVIVGEVRAEVGAVAEYRPVLHQPVVKEDLLAGADVTSGEQNPAGGIDEPCRNRRVVLIGLVGQDPEDQEPE